MLGPKDIRITKTDYQGITNLVGVVPSPTRSIIDLYINYKNLYKSFQLIKLV